MSKPINYLSPSLQKAVHSFIVRANLSQLDCELLFDILSFTYHEGKLIAVERILNGNFGEAENLNDENKS